MDKTVLRASGVREPQVVAFVSQLQKHWVRRWRIVQVCIEPGVRSGAHGGHHENRSHVLVNFASVAAALHFATLLRDVHERDGVAIVGDNFHRLPVILPDTSLRRPRLVLLFLIVSLRGG